MRNTGDGRAPSFIRQAAHRLAQLSAALGLISALACTRVPGPKGPGRVEVVKRLELEGVPKAQIEVDIRDGIGTKESGGFPVFVYEEFDENVLNHDLERVEREMRRRGYYEAKVSVARVQREPDIQKKGKTLSPVRIYVRVEPGPPVFIRSVKTEGLAALPFEVARAAANENRLRQNQVFDEDQFEAAKLDVQNALADRGYPFAKVEGLAQVDLANHGASIVLSATPGPRSRLGLVSIEGLEKLDEAPVRRVLNLREGQYYSRSQIREARAALIDLGVFSRVEIVPDLGDPNSATVPLTVRLEESTLKELSLGVGARLDLIRLAAVGQGTWTHRNFLGGLRKFSVSTRPGLTFFPTAFDTSTPIVAPTTVFLENFLNVRLEQPGFVEARTRGFVEADYNVYPLLWPPPTDVDPRDEHVIGYHELGTGMGLSRNFFGRLLSTTLSYNWQANIPLEYQHGKSYENGVYVDYPDLLTVLVAYPELLTTVDLRDDPLQPTKGIYFSNSLQVANKAFGGTLNDVRIHPEIRTFYPLDNDHKLVLATRFGVGMLFPFNYGTAMNTAGGDINFSNPAVYNDQQKLVFRTFFSGGPGSNRGYPFRRVGPQGPIGFLIPPNLDCSAANPDGRCVRPLGGLSMWEASMELRYRFLEKWSFVTFVDASDVSTRQAYFSFLEPHISLGPGIRYFSPVGPIRVDLGWRVPGLQKLKDAKVPEPPDVSEVAPYNRKTVQLALQILIGEDF